MARRLLKKLSTCVKIGGTGLALLATQGCPPTTPTTGRAVSVESGAFHTCVLRANHKVSCWGSNVWGEVGGSDIHQDYLQPTDVAGIADATAISVGWWHSCAIVSGGQVKCWGRNNYGQLGNGTTTGLAVTTPVVVQGLSNATSISSGYAHTCAIVSSPASAVCWGWNSAGQLGNLTLSDSSVPVPVLTGAGTMAMSTSIAAGNLHTCTITTGGKTQCWGANEQHQFGNGTTQDSTSPVAGGLVAESITLGGLDTVVSGNDGSCAIGSSAPPAQVWCWGANSQGRFGLGNLTEQPYAAQVPTAADPTGSPTAVDVFLDNACVVMSSGSVLCAGSNSAGQLGSTDPSGSSTMVAVSGVTTATAVSLGATHACAVLSSGGVDCWGSDDSGQLGNGTASSSSAPVHVLSIP